MASILIVDDEEQGRRLLARVLERGGHDSCQAASAAEARTLLRNQSFEYDLRATQEAYSVMNCIHISALPT